MSKFFAAAAIVLGLYGAINILTIGESDHAYTITLSGQANKIDAAKEDVFEIDWNHTTTFTVKNDAVVDLYFVMDGGPNNSKCRIKLDPPEAGKCQTAVISIPKAESRTFTATALDMSEYDYSWIKVKPFNAAWPRFKSDVNVGTNVGQLKKVDPDLELERDYGMLTEFGALVAGVVAALAAWLTRRRS